MKRIILIASTAVLGFVSNVRASGTANWNFPACVPSTINSVTTTSICPGAGLAVSYNFYAPPLPVPTSAAPYTNEAYRIMVAISDGGGYSLTENRTAFAGLGISATVRNLSGTIVVPITKWTSGPAGFNVKIQRRLWNNTTGMWTSWTDFDNFYPIPGDPTPKISMPATNANFSFKVNGKVQTTNTDYPEIIRCNGGDITIDGITGMGEATSIVTSIEGGFLTGAGIFEPTVGPVYAVSYPSWMPWYSLLAPFPSFWAVRSTLATWYYVRATVTVTGPCGTTTKSMVFKVINHSALVNFQLRDAFTGNDQPLEKSLPIADIGSQTTLTSIVSTPGWQGASFGGVYGSGASVLSGTASGVSSNYKVTRVNSLTGIDIGSPIVNYTQPSVLSIYVPFDGKSIPVKYFSTNHATIAPYGASAGGDYTFKVTVTVSTTECGDVSDYSYFKIIDGLIGSGAENWRTSENPIATGGEAMQQTIAAYPNPTNKMLTFDYGNIQNEGNSIRVVISDMMGRKVLNEDALPVVNHKANLNIEQLPAGNYFYKAEIAGKEFTGRITKN